MRIQHNISALNTQRQLKLNNSRANKALEKLSSGFKINRAGNDVAWLLVSEEVRNQIRGLNMAEKNALDGISLIQTAKGGRKSMPRYNVCECLQYKLLTTVILTVMRRYVNP